MNNKFSCSFFTYNMYNKSSKNFSIFSNKLFINNIHTNIILNKSLSLGQISKLMIGEESLGESLENPSSAINEKISEGKILNEFSINNISKNFF
jgi:hypothetical protein